MCVSVHAASRTIEFCLFALKLPVLSFFVITVNSLNATI